MEFIIFFIPVALLLLVKYWFPKRITFFEVGVGVVLITLSAYLVFHYNIFSKIIDEEILNGEVIEKVRINVDCGHSYNCECNGSTSTETCTCFEHSHDIDWKLKTTVGDITISRVDRQGTTPPEDWVNAYASEPVSRVGLYENYLQGAESSLFNDKHFVVETRFKHLIPSYPIEIYNNYRFNHALAMEVSVPDLGEWNNLLAESLKKLGPEKQVNVLMLMVNTDDASYARSLEKSWLRGNKNDVIVVVGSTNYPHINWVEIVSWTPSELFKVQLRDEIKAQGTLIPAQIIPIIENHVRTKYIRLDMSQFEHLKSEVKVSKNTYYWVFSFLVLGSLVFSFIAYKYKLSELFIRIGSIALLLGFSYILININFFIIFFSFPVGVVIWLVWSHFSTKRKMKNAK
ncbi:hypothetical protein CW745_01290 [Psychromonas sp. psych-6C06]|uniref:hypothetical protein n=1 Tax=Psychromonas sp. psych-6C06 TaxID=2058089 RepID=UPI000C340114|nr:hypothetical protein [Psychromonas sp. psych-6C06]PKF63514.1 hypothetical protein CW745_01290 [Psychromonas sp. psych-6C06]